MANFDMVAANALLKEWYDGQIPENEVYGVGRFWTMIEKAAAGGKTFPEPIIIGAGNASSNFVVSQTYQNPVNSKNFQVVATTAYSLATIDNLTAESMATDRGAFVRGLKTVTDGAFRAVGLKMSRQAYRTKVGTITSYTVGASGVMTLANNADIVFFEVGNVLQSISADSSGATPDAGLGFVIARSVTNGTITVSATAGGGGGTPTGWTTGHFLLQYGDFNASTSGLLDWLPATDPTSGDNFFGVDRSQDPTRLAGVRYNGTALPIKEALLKAANLTVREGGEPDVCFMNFDSWSALELSLMTQVRYTDVKVGAIAFPAIVINSEAGQIKVIADRNCPAKTAFLLSMKTWKVRSVGGDVPRVLLYDDGNYFLRSSTQDAMESRIGGYPQFTCNAPGWNAYVSLGA